MEGRPRTNPEQDRVLAQGRSSGECQRLKSDIYLSLSVWHSTSITNFPRENLFEWSFQLNDIKFNRFDSSWIIYSIFIFYFEFWCGRNLRVHLSIGCPRYTERGWVVRLSGLDTCEASVVAGQSIAFLKFLAFFKRRIGGDGELRTRIGVVEDWASFEHWDPGIFWDSEIGSDNMVVRKYHSVVLLLP